jgi:signal transduction histidine kinase
MSAPSKEIPTGIDFATEVKSDRLSLLWKATMAACGAIILFGFLFASWRDDSPILWSYAPALMIGFCLLTRLLLGRQRFILATLAYTLGSVAAVGVALADGGQMTVQLLPYVYVVIIFMAGLMLHPQITFLIAVVAAALTVIVPATALGSLDFFTGHHAFAIALMFLSALLSAQVSGELYAVTEWALLNYQRQRRTNLDLFESRLALERSLRRAEALSLQIQDANVELEAAHKAAEAAKNFRGQFLANMSHELRTPLNAIIGFSETMLQFPVMYDNHALPDAYRTDLSQVFTSGQQLLTVINDILDLARVDAGKLEVKMKPVEIGPVIEGVIATSGGLVGGKPIKLESDLPDQLPMVMADESRLRQVLLNLYSNAIKFTNSGSVTVKVREVDDDRVQFSVSDTGVGIPAEQAELIFEEFRQSEGGSRDPRAGAGLGLAICRQLMGLMNGKIWVESVVGEGSTFHFSLQRHQAVEDEQASKHPGTAATQGGSNNNVEETSTAVDEVVMEQAVSVESSAIQSGANREGN